MMHGMRVTNSVEVTRSFHLGMCAPNNQWAFDGTGTGHGRDITTDTGWKIVLDRGLDIFQAPIRKEGFSLGDRLQEHRTIKGFYVTYVQTNDRKNQVA